MSRNSVADRLDPDTRTMSRAELYASSSAISSSSPSSRESSPGRGISQQELRDAFARAQGSIDINAFGAQAEAALEHQPDSVTLSDDKLDDKSPENEENDDTYAFRLFHAPSTTATAGASVATFASSRPTQIRLSSPTSANQTSSVSQRPPSYFFSRKFSIPERAIALSGDDILRLSARPCAGLTYSWRVQHWPVSRLSKALRLGAPLAPRRHKDQSSADTQADDVQEKDTQADQGAKRKRRRKGKKMRMKIRKSLAAAKEAVRKKEDAAREKEEHLREKKTRLNRIKQLRRREKARVLKGSAATADAADADAAASENTTAASSAAASAAIGDPDRSRDYHPNPSRHAGQQIE